MKDALLEEYKIRKKQWEELNRPESTEEYEKAFKEIMKELKELVDHYEPMNSGGSFNALVKRLKGILIRYGY